jgi:excisionase family DNA binding protein
MRLLRWLRLELIGRGDAPMSLTEPGTVAPTSEDVALARDSSLALSRVAGQLAAGNLSVGDASQVHLQVNSGGETTGGESVSIPTSAFRLLMEILDQMGQGNAVTILPTHAELTTAEAAEILNVSRPFVIKLIDEKTLPCRMVGSHRRLLLKDVIDYKRAIDADRRKALEALAAQAQELRMGY